MVLNRSDDEDTVDREKAQERKHQQELERQAEQAALKQATENAVHANPDFLEQIQKSDIDTEDFEGLESMLGPVTSGAIILGQRSEDYEREAKWGNVARAERAINEGTPGRLCQDDLRGIAMGTHKRDSKAPPEEYTVDERRAIRDAFQHVLTNQMTLSVDARALRSMTEATAVTRSEGETDDSMRSSAANFFE